jgi:hypothetical protein
MFGHIGSLSSEKQYNHETAKYRDRGDWLWVPK